MSPIYKISKLKVDNFLQLIFLLLPYTIIFSIFITEIFLIILSTYYLKENFENINNTIKQNKIIKSLLFFYLITVLSAVVNFDNLNIFLKNLVYIRFIFYAISISWIINKFNFLKKLFLFSILSSIIFLLLGSIYEFILKRNCVTFIEGNVPFFYGDYFLCSEKYFIGNLIRSDRLSSFFGDEMIVGSYVSRLLPLICFLIIDQFDKTSRERITLYLTIIISSLIVIMSGERIALFYIILFLIIFFIFTDFKFKTLTILFCSVVSFLFITSSETLNKRLFETTFSQIFLDNKNNSKITFFSIEHESHAIAALKIFKDNPVLGIGPKKFRFECLKKKYNISEYSCSTHPHNFYIQLLSETGIIGFIIPIFILIKLFIYYIKIIYLKISAQTNKISLKHVYLYSCFLFTFFPIIPTGNIFNNWLSIIFYIPLGFLINVNKK